MKEEDEEIIEEVKPYKAKGNLNTAISNPDINIDSKMNINIKEENTGINDLSEPIEEKKEINKKNITEKKKNTKQKNKTEEKENKNRTEEKNTTLSITRIIKIVLLIILIIFVFVLGIPLIP